MDTLLAYTEGAVGSPALLFILLFLFSAVNAFVPPVPAEVLTLTAAYLAGQNGGSPLAVWLGAASGMAIASVALFSLISSHSDRVLRTRLVARLANAGRLSLLRRWFARYGVWAIVASRCIPGMSVASVVAAGLFLSDGRRAVLAICLANFAFYGAIAAVGFSVGKGWYQGARWLSTLVSY